MGMGLRLHVMVEHCGRQLTMMRPLTRATVAVAPITRIEAQDGAVGRMLARMRERGYR